MVKNISVALGDPDIYTNALSNPHLPFVREWDPTSEEETEIIEFWTPKEVGRRLGNRMFAEKCGFHADEYDELRILWNKKGGTSCRDQEKGIFDTTDERLVAGGFSNWGEHSLANGTGLFDTTDKRLVAGGFSNWGEYISANGTGLYDTTDERLVAGGFSNWGEHSLANGTGLFDTTDERLVAGGFSNWGDHAVANGTGQYADKNSELRNLWNKKGGTTQGNLNKESDGHWMHTQMVNADINQQRVIDFVERVRAIFICFLLLIITFFQVLIMYVFKNGHSVFDKGTGLDEIVKSLRRAFKKMVLTCVGRKPDTKFPFSSDELILIRDRIEATPKFKALAETKHFCFIPSKCKNTPCGCVHGKTHFKL
jgi:hypothetical protein